MSRFAIVCPIVAAAVACTTTPQPTPEPSSPPRGETPQTPLPSGPKQVAIAIDQERPSWPPEPLEPMEPMEGDGIWAPVPAFVLGASAGSPTMVKTLLHSRKPGKLRARPGPHPIALVAWDPEQVELRLTAGAREPKLPYPKRGTGKIPETPETLARLMASFNGGWLKKHALNSGIMWDGTLGLPPGPERATVVMREGLRVEMGTWPKEKGIALSKDIHSFRQNIEPVLDGETFNPLGRQGRWGATGGVADADGEFTIRSGLCRTKEGFLVYLWGRHLDAAQLAEAMRHARCVYGMHLDMNGVHAGFEFYRINSIGPGPKWKPEKLTYAVESDRLHPDIRYPKAKFLASRNVKDVFYLLHVPVLPAALGAVALKPTPRPNSARRHAPVVAGRHPNHPKLRVVLWDTHRMVLPPKGKPVEARGGLQVVLNPGKAPSSGDQVIFGAGSPLTVKPLNGELKAVEGRAVVLGVQGRFAAFVEASADALTAAREVMAAWGGATWFVLGQGAGLDVLTQIGAGVWVSYDGVATEGVPVGASPEVPQGARVFGLPAEQAAVGPLELPDMGAEPGTTPP
ncbi:MAG: hypothetical protein AAFX99_25370 [Myxococcota bacterium]